MKKIRNLVIAAFALVLLAGCTMKEEFTLKISSDKQVQVAVKMLVDNESVDSMIAMSDTTTLEENATAKTYTAQDRMNYFKENSCKTVEEGYTCEPITEGNNTGFVMTSTKTDIDSITGTGDKINIASYEDAGVDAKLFTKDGDVYSSNLTYQLDQNAEINSYVDSSESFTFAFTIELPNKSISNNADVVSSDGQTLTWNIDPKTSKSIEFSFKFDPTNVSTTTTNNGNTSNTKSTTTTTTNNSKNDLISEKTDTILGMAKTTFILLVVGIVVGLGLISVLIIIFARSSSKNNHNTQAQAQASSETAQMFKNPELNINKDNSVNPQSQTQPVDNQDSLTESVDNMTDTNKTE